MLSARDMELLGDREVFRVRGEALQRAQRGADRVLVGVLAEREDGLLEGSNETR